MKTLCILCVFHVVQSAALLHRGKPHYEVSLTPDGHAGKDGQEAPVFVVQGFLAHNATGRIAVSVAGRHRHLAENGGHASVKEECAKVCGKTADSSCIPECQVKLYGCLDYDRKTAEGAKQYEECEKRVLNTYAKFAEDWESTHPYLADLLLRRKRVITAVDIDRVQDECAAACGKGVDSSCVPECQVKLYACLDHDRKVPDGLKKYEECEKKVLDTYRNFAADWEATHPYLLAVGRHTSAKDLRSIRDKCVADCGSSSKGSCRPRCETASYTCLHIDVSEDAAKYKSCIDGIKSTVTAPLQASLELAAIGQACSSACGLGLDASCEPECEVQMYGCADNKAGGKQYTDCTEKVLRRYETFASHWNAAHPYLLAKSGHADAELLDEVHDDCMEACGDGVDSSCIPECQVKLYNCVDHDRKTDEGAKKYKACKAEVLAKYEKFADDWDATHPYLLAVHRHVSSAELLHIADKCAKACGKGVDSSCVPECQVDMYACLDNDRKTKEGAKLYDECEARVIAEFEKFGANWDAKHPY